MNETPCQLYDVPLIKEGRAQWHVPLTLRARLRLLMRRHLGYTARRRLKRWWLAHRPTPRPHPATRAERVSLQKGDRVRVRAREEIEKTFSRGRTLKGCSFMREMWPYCGTEQRVLKPVNVFLDERDYRLKTTSGTVLLENVICEGTELYGPCDRSCFYFWREEWLEKIADGTE